MPTATIEEPIQETQADSLLKTWQDFIKSGQELAKLGGTKKNLIVLRSDKSVQTSIFSRNPRIAAALSIPSELVEFIRAHISRENEGELRETFQGTDIHVRMARNCLKWGFEYPYLGMTSHTWNPRQGHHRAITAFKRSGENGTTTYFARLGGLGGVEVYYHPDAKLPQAGRSIQEFEAALPKGIAGNSPSEHFNPGRTQPIHVMPGTTNMPLMQPYMITKVEKQEITKMLKEIRPNTYLLAPVNMFSVPKVCSGEWSHIVYGTCSTANTLTRIASVLLQIAQGEEKLLGLIVEKLHQHMAAADYKLHQLLSSNGDLSTPKYWSNLTQENAKYLRTKSVAERLHRNKTYQLFPWLKLVADPFLPWNRNNLGAIMKFGAPKSTFADNQTDVKTILQTLLDSPCPEL